MSEMNPIARFFVNLSGTRRSARYYAWIQAHAGIRPGATCLEIGCGNGRLAARVADGLAPREYVAVDIDPKQLDEAGRTLHRLYPSGVPPGILLRPADMTRLPFPSGTFDVVLAFVALHHASPHHRDFSRVPTALAEVDRVLRPGGALVYSEMFHQVPIRDWFSQRGYSLDAVERHWRVEFVVRHKPLATPASGDPRPVTAVP